MVCQSNDINGRDRIEATIVRAPTAHAPRAGAFASDRLTDATGSRRKDNSSDQNGFPVIRAQHVRDSSGIGAVDFAEATVPVTGTIPPYSARNMYESKPRSERSIRSKFQFTSPRVRAPCTRHPPTIVRATSLTERPVITGFADLRLVGDTPTKSSSSLTFAARQDERTPCASHGSTVFIQRDEDDLVPIAHHTSGATVESNQAHPSVQQFTREDFDRRIAIESKIPSAIASQWSDVFAAERVTPRVEHLSPGHHSFAAEKRSAGGRRSVREPVFHGHQSASDD